MTATYNGKLEERPAPQARPCRRREPRPAFRGSRPGRGAAPPLRFARLRVGRRPARWPSCCVSRPCGLRDSPLSSSASVHSPPPLATPRPRPGVRPSPAAGGCAQLVAVNGTPASLCARASPAAPRPLRPTRTRVTVCAVCAGSASRDAEPGSHAAGPMRSPGSSDENACCFRALPNVIVLQFLIFFPPI